MKIIEDANMVEHIRRPWRRRLFSLTPWRRTEIVPCQSALRIGRDTIVMHPQTARVYRDAIRKIIA